MRWGIDRGRGAGMMMGNEGREEYSKVRDGMEWNGSGGGGIEDEREVKRNRRGRENKR